MKNVLLFILILMVSGCENMIIGPEPENTPGGNFEVLWKTMDEKYGLFPVSNVNWDSLYQVYSARIDDSTPESELWDICCRLLSHLGNGHISLVNENYTKGFNPDSPDKDFRDGVSIDLIKSKYLIDPAITGEGNILYGRVKNTALGYIYILSFSGAPNGRDWIRDLDNVIRSMMDCEGMILDVRNNGGGYTRNDEYAGSLFTDHEFTYYFSSRKTDKGHDDFGDPIAKKIYPHPDSLLYLKKNAILTNRFTASGAEAFTIMLNTLPYSTQIGDTTIGAIGEVSQVAQMPNGWTLYYPCTLTRLEDGTSPEGIGLIPDIEINNTPGDVDAGVDRVIERAILHLEQLP